MVFKLAEKNANDLNKVLNLTSPGFLCRLAKDSVEQMKSNVFWCNSYMTTKASLRNVCLNDLYHCEDLRELTVEGDIHGVVSALQMSVPWMPNGR